ncbi:hypothetical protein PROAA_310012 [Candidatus Propionivibrio aalborgensis]|uniref:Uncharacterized protein n=1 Tax=Candidatus Propionivibrio aalborgensis TaxID=1860101 RepID=A0A1A8XX07_9RHOO|nr:hypothetical protein PROAA_310012 [Candidatus Propionivibrio aalborgensis]
MHIIDADALSVARLQLTEQWQWIVIIAKAHGLAGHQRVKRAKYGGVAKSLGDAARIEWINGFFGRLVASVHAYLQEITRLIGACILQHLGHQVFDMDRRWP